MIKKTLISRSFSASICALLTGFIGVFLWSHPLGDVWSNASYDTSLLIGTRRVANEVVVIALDNDAYDHFGQTRDRPWDRSLHAKLVNRLADDGCALLVFDVFFKRKGDPKKDDELAKALSRSANVVLMAEQAEITHPSLEGVHPVLPEESFLGATGNWGIGWLSPDTDLVVRRHWPFPSPGPFPSLPWKAAQLSRANLSQSPEPRWLRYYGFNGAWSKMGYRFALSQPTNYFRNKVVFVGNSPQSEIVDYEPDKFRTPYTRWTGEMASGMEIQATEYLNLVVGDWLRRLPPSLEASTLACAGLILGFAMARVAMSKRITIAILSALGLSAAGMLDISISNYWFPWLIVVGAQIPCAFALGSAFAGLRRNTFEHQKDLPQTPGYELIDPPFAEGAYGNVWLARNAVGQWQALKTVYLEKFAQNPRPYEREFNGVKNYKPVSDRHPGLLRVDFVSRNDELGYFFYVMELGDSLVKDWRKIPQSYKPCDLATLRSQADQRCLPLAQCLQIGLALADALHFLHTQGLTHRDVKPSNIIFVDGQPKLADIGLVAERGFSGKEATLVGTPGYMPPFPEAPGTPQADIYGLGMLLYVIRTGKEPAHFPEVSTSLIEKAESTEFVPLNDIILKACDPSKESRYATAKEMHSALLEAEGLLTKKLPETE